MAALWAMGNSTLFAQNNPIAAPTNSPPPAAPAAVPGIQNPAAPSPYGTPLPNNASITAPIWPPAGKTVPAAPGAVSDLQNPPPPPVIPDPSATPAPAAPPVADPPAEAICCDPSAPSWWKRVPAVRPMPPVGYFPIPPTGPGYYSALDLLLDRPRENRPKFPYSATSAMFNSFYDADFRYLDDPNNTQFDYLDFLHQIHIGCNWVFNTGGEYRNRYMQEDNSRLAPGGPTNDYDLQRTRVYADLWYRDWFRAYVEFLSAQTFGQTLAPLAIDYDPYDFLNLFIDLKIPGTGDHPAYFRVGRQEMLLGSQRLISPLDWANTRRSFEGVRAFRQGDKFDVDLFWVRPDIRTPASGGMAFRDENQDFAGAWVTYHPQKGQFVDAYYLFLDNRNVSVVSGLLRAPCVVNTIGARYVGSQKQLLWDMEDMLQYGFQGAPIFAAATTAGLGWNFAKLPLNPTWWVYYDYASGTAYGAGPTEFNTFNQLFPFGHYYLGFLDLVGRQNIHDLNTHLFLYPSKFITFWFQYHHFELDSPSDGLFSKASAVERRAAAGGAGQTVGDEFDILVNFHLGNHSDLLGGYSLMAPGSFIAKTGSSTMPSLAYVQYSFKW
jgi:hypothetical protein